MKIALVHDYLNQYGGAERVLEVLCELFPYAPIYTTLYDPVATRGAFVDREIRTSFLQNIPGSRRYHHAFSALMPLGVEQFDTSAFDVVLSVSSSFAKGIITKPHTRHISYCLTPPRFLWDDSQKFVQEFQYPWLLKKLLPPMLSHLRMWDVAAAQRADQTIAISNIVQRRIKKYYNQEAKVIYPPVATAKFTMSKQIDDYFLMVGRLVSYKKFDLAIRVFNQLGWPLKIVGTGIEENRLKTLARSNIQFLGKADDIQLAELYQHARALIFPQEEDFGIVPLEAMASGRPVIAYRSGGAEETIIDGVTGIFFDEQNDISLMMVLQTFDQIHFDPLVCRAQAEKFDVEVFKKNILQSI